MFRNREIYFSYFLWIVLRTRTQILSRKIFHFRFECPIHRHMLNKRQIVFFRQSPIVGTKSRRFVRNTRTLLGRHEIRRIYFPSVFMVFKRCIVHVIIKRRFVFEANEFASFPSLSSLWLPFFPLCPFVCCDNKPTFCLNRNVINISPHSERNIPRQSPRRRRPSKHVHVRLP